MPRKLGEYIADLIGIMAECNPEALARMRQVVGDRRARISLDAEAVEVSFGSAGLNVTSASPGGSCDGFGATDSNTVVDLLKSHATLNEVILNDRLRVLADTENVVKMFNAIEILLDSASRIPALQTLAEEFCSERRIYGTSLLSNRHSASWYPFVCEPTELELLRRLDVLPEMRGLRDDSAGQWRFRETK